MDDVPSGVENGQPSVQNCDVIVPDHDYNDPVDSVVPGKSCNDCQDCEVSNKRFRKVDYDSDCAVLGEVWCSQIC